MTNIVVLIKQVPDTWSERKLTDGDFTLDRAAADAVLDEINERAVEEAPLIKEKEAANGTESTVTVLTAGPERATEAIRKALSMGADKAVHLATMACTAPTSCRRWALARALAPSRAPSWSSPVTRPPTASAARCQRSSPSIGACRS